MGAKDNDDKARKEVNVARGKSKASKASSAKASKGNNAKASKANKDNSSREINNNKGNNAKAINKVNKVNALASKARDRKPDKATSPENKGRDAPVKAKGKVRGKGNKESNIRGERNKTK